MKKLRLLVLILVVIHSSIYCQLCFSPASSYSVDAGPFYIISLDFNKDGNTDLATANWHSGYITILIGNGQGNFTPTAVLVVGGGNLGIVSADFNSDGNPDIATANQTAGSSHSTAVIFGDGLGGVTGIAKFLIGVGPVNITTGDFNGDGKTDIATANHASMDVSVLIGDGSGGFAPAVNYSVGITGMFGPYYVRSADLNNDGRSDIVASNSYTNTVSVFLSNAGGGFSAPINYITGQGPFGLRIFDVSGDGNLDLIVGNNGSGNISVLKGNGTGGFFPAVFFPAAVGPIDISLGDFNGDGIMDIASMSHNYGGYGGSVSFLTGDGTGNFYMAAPVFSVGLHPHSVTSGDFNNDGRADIATADLDSNTVSVLLNNPFLISASASSSVICIGDKVTLYGSGATSYTWSGGVGNGIPFIPNASAGYFVVGTNSLGCQSAASIFVTVSTIPNISVTASSTNICVGQNVIISATGADVFQWSPGPAINSSSLIVFPASTTIYTVTGTNAGCPADTKTLAVSVNPLPFVSISSANSVICKGQSVMLTASGASSYLWNTGSLNSTIIVSPTLTTNYTVTGTAANGCSHSSIFTQSVSLCADAVELASANELIEIYPNPNNGSFIISSKKETSLSIINQLGQIIENFSLNTLNSLQVSVTGLPAGIYVRRSAARG